MKHEWQPIETAPRDRYVLLDMSYVDQDDRSIVECYVAAIFDDTDTEYCWDTGDVSYSRGAPRAWMEIPRTKTLAAPAEHATTLEI